MTDLADNPIYNRMVQGSRRLPLAVGILIAVVMAAAGNVIWLTFLRNISLSTFLGNAIYYGNEFRLNSINILVSSSLVISMLPLSGAMILTALMVVRHGSAEELAPVKISSMTELDIVRGFIEGARHRFRDWLLIGLGILMSALMFIFFYLGPVLFIAELVGIGVLYITVAWPLILTAGVWAGLLNPRSSILLGFGLMLILAIYTFVAAYVVYGLFERALSPQFWLMISWAVIVYFIMGMIIPYVALRILRADCVRLISKMEL